ncbi:uncharacterized protein TNCV_4309611 [Trichonephila clavipes]|nr:uncharacterized protein TNCV_4309611 [Trichonephila clavipes]
MPWPAALDYAVEDPWREQLDINGLTDARLGLSQVSLLAKGGRETHPGALRTTHVHWQLYGTCIVLLEDAIILRKKMRM